jgi:hypothetical protein
MQTTNLWNFIRKTSDPVKTAAFEHGKAMPVQVLDMQDYEKLLGLVGQPTYRSPVVVQAVAGSSPVAHP